MMQHIGNQSIKSIGCVSLGAGIFYAMDIGRGQNLILMGWLKSEKNESRETNRAM